MIGEVLQAFGIEYAAAGPADDALSRRTREGIPPPVLIGCCHEEFAVAMAQGYAKIAGKPMAALLDGESAVKRAAMAIFNAFTDRVPVLLFVAKGDSAGARDPMASVREFIKWDGEAGSPQTFPAVAARACQAALTPPMGPGGDHLRSLYRRVIASAGQLAACRGALSTARRSRRGLPRPRSCWQAPSGP